MKKIVTLLLVTLVIFVLSACTNNPEESTNVKKNSDSIDVYTTVYPLSYFTERIGGNYVNVTSIYPPGANEHSFEPTQKDMISLAEADLFFYIGLGLEGFVENAKSSLAKEDVQLVAVADYVSDVQLDISTGHTHAEAIEEEHHHEEHDDHHESEVIGHVDHPESHEGHNHGNIDPHIWLSPTISKQIALAIKDSLVEEMPEQEAVFVENYENLVFELTSLNEQFEQLASEVSSKTFFVSHAAFGYIAGEYGFKQVPVAGLNSQSEPSQKELTQIVDLAKESNIQHILFEQNVSSNLASVIQHEVGAEPLILHNLSVLTNEDIKNNETYFTLMEKNIETLRTALN